jgi:hypothetical protein
MVVNSISSDCLRLLDLVVSEWQRPSEERCGNKGEVWNEWLGYERVLGGSGVVEENRGGYVGSVADALNRS